MLRGPRRAAPPRAPPDRAADRCGRRAARPARWRGGRAGSTARRDRRAGTRCASASSRSAEVSLCRTRRSYSQRLSVAMPSRASNAARAMALSAPGIATKLSGAGGRRPGMAIEPAQGQAGVVRAGLAGGERLPALAGRGVVAVRVPGAARPIDRGHGFVAPGVAAREPVELGGGERGRRPRGARSWRRGRRRWARSGCSGSGWRSAGSSRGPGRRPDRPRRGRPAGRARSWRPWCRADRRGAPARAPTRPGPRRPRGPGHGRADRRPPRRGRAARAPARTAARRRRGGRAGSASSRRRSDPRPSRDRRANAASNAWTARKWRPHSGRASDLELFGRRQRGEGAVEQAHRVAHFAGLRRAATRP